MSAIPHVYAAIAKVAGEIAKTGISKSRQNKQQGYAFRGIDEIYNNLAVLLSENGLLILPNVLERLTVERESKAGGLLFSVTVKVEFSFVSAQDGSVHKVVTYGEAMDSGDKATNKAMSAAYKYACLQAFCIPTEGDNDADAVTHEVAAKKAKPVAATEAEVNMVLEAVKEAQNEKEFLEVKETKLGALWSRLTEADQKKLTDAFVKRAADLGVKPKEKTINGSGKTALQQKLDRADSVMAAV